MTLAQYLADLEMSDAEFGRRVGKKRQEVQQYRLGNRIPSLETMKKIAEETGGAVTANDFFGLAA